MCTLLHNQGALGMSIQIWCLTWESKMHVWVPKVYSLKVSWELEVVLTPKAPWPRYAKPVGHMWPRTAMNVVKQKIMRSLKLLWDFFFWWFSCCSIAYFLSVNPVGDKVAFWCQKVGFTYFRTLFRTNLDKNGFCKKIVMNAPSPINKPRRLLTYLLQGP